MPVPSPPAARPLVAAIDLDEVVYPFVVTLREWMVQRCGRMPESCPDPVVYDFAHEWGMTMEEFRAQFRAAADGGVLYRTGDPYPGSADGLRRLAGAGHELHLVTARDPVDRDATVAWLSDHAIPWDGLTFTRDKASVRADVFVDDLPSHYAALRAVGTDCWLVARAWNEGTPERADAARRDRLVGGVGEFADAVLSLAPGR